jgi:hypothetical protein
VTAPSVTSPRSPPPPEPPKKKVLNVRAVDLDIAGNASSHHTDAYELVEPRGEVDDNTGLPREQRLVVRRGQDVKVKLKFDRDYDAKTDDLKLALEYQFCKCIRVQLHGPVSLKCSCFPKRMYISFHFRNCYPPLQYTHGEREREREREREIHSEEIEREREGEEVEGRYREVNYREREKDRDK